MDHDFGKYVDEFALICNITMYNAPFVEITCLMGDQYERSQIYKASNVFLLGISKNRIVIISGPVCTGNDLYLHISLHTYLIIVSSTR